MIFSVIIVNCGFKKIRRNKPSPSTAKSSTVENNGDNKSIVNTAISLWFNYDGPTEVNIYALF
jgi:hypothetical protein